MLNGGCLCGEVAFEVADDFQFLNFCHCTQCRQTTGSAHASNLFTDAENFRWLSGEDKVKRYDMPGRSITSAFCTECGSGLPYKSLSSGRFIVPAGTLTGPLSKMPPSVRNIFWGERAEWYEGGVASERFETWPG